MDRSGSFEDERLVLVDERDLELGEVGKAEAHLGRGRLHRAIAVAVFDPGGRLLLARRSGHKPLWPGHWDATVASHPGPGEGYAAAARRRTRQELGLAVECAGSARFRYRITFADVGVEHEVCGALFGVVDSRAVITPDAAEIDALQWVEPADLAARIAGGAEPICPWLPMTLAALEPTAVLATPGGGELIEASRVWLAQAPLDGPWELLEGLD
jgi:isopentenyl-diphosphate delta-isomerase